MKDENKPKPKPQASSPSRRPPRGPTVATGFGDDDEPKKKRKYETVRIILPPKPSVPPTKAATRIMHSKRFMWMDTPLQPLRIPGGWKVEYNAGLYEIDPEPDKIPPLEYSCFFREDMLQMKHQYRDRLVDVGWYPAGDLKHGEYAIHIHEGDWRGRLLHEFRTRDRRLLVAELERIFISIAEGQL